MKKSRLKKILLICGNIIFIVIMLFISFRKNSVKTQRMVHIGVCTFHVHSVIWVQDEKMIKKLSNKNEDIDLRLQSFDLASDQEIESKLLELAQKKYDMICVLNYSNQEFIEKIKEMYPNVKFVFMDSLEDNHLLYRHIKIFLSGINVSRAE